MTWLRLDETENAIDNLEMASHFIRGIQSERKWKWAIIALHQALYGFAVCATRGTNSSLSLSDPSDHESRLIGVWEAIRRAKDKAWMPWDQSLPLVTAPAEDEAIKRLTQEFRNEFEHFRLKAWSIEVSGMPAILTHVLRVIRHLAHDANCVTYADDEQEECARAALDSLTALLSRETAA